MVKYARLAQASRRVPACDAAIVGIQMGRDQDRTGDSRLAGEGQKVTYGLVTDCDITHSFHPTRRGSCQRVVCQNLSLSEGFLTIFFFCRANLASAQK